MGGWGWVVGRRVRCPRTATRYLLGRHAVGLHHCVVIGSGAGGDQMRRGEALAFVCTVGCQVGGEQSVAIAPPLLGGGDWQVRSCGERLRAVCVLRVVVTRPWGSITGVSSCVSCATVVVCVRGNGRRHVLCNGLMVRVAWLCRASMVYSVVPQRCGRRREMGEHEV